MNTSFSASLRLNLCSQSLFSAFCLVSGEYRVTESQDSSFVAQEIRCLLDNDDPTPIYKSKILLTMRDPSRNDPITRHTKLVY